MTNSYIGQKLTFLSPAKINLFLHVVGRNPNGYHQLETLFQFISLYDKLSFTITNSDTITLKNAVKGVATADNLMVKAAAALKPYLHNKFGVIMDIEKQIPMGGGLGGGSSNAATVLLVLNQLWQINLPSSKLAEIGLKLGADVPIFIVGHAAFAQGIGEQLTLVEPEECWYLITKPNCAIATQSVFQHSDLPRNTKKLPQPFLLVNSWFSQTQNDCEIPVLKQYPEVANLLAHLLEYAPSRMTGTGSCLFSCFSSEQQAKICQQSLPDSVTSFVVKGLNTSPVHQSLQSIDNRLR